MRRLAALVLVVLLAGCTRPPAAQEVAPLALVETPPAPASAFVAQPVPELDASLRVVERWVRPNDAVVAHATARAAQHEWYLAARNPLAHAVPQGELELRPDGASVLDVRREGRHVLALDGAGARLNVSIVDGALPLRLEARLVEDEHGVRFAPEELVGGGGSVLALESQLSQPALVRRVDWMARLGSGDSISFLMPDVAHELGDYDLVVVSRDGAGAVGDASARIIYDNRKPDANQTFGPFTGAFRLPPVAGEPGVARHAWRSAHPLASLDVTVTSASDAPLPAGVRVVLVDAEGTPRGSTEGDGFLATQLPAGAYEFHVEPRGGALVEYRVEARGVWQLTPPASFFRE